MDPITKWDRLFSIAANVAKFCYYALKALLTFLGM